jgi:hypothetical protein
MGTIWTLAPFIFAFGVMVIISRITMDPKFIMGGGVAGAVFYYLFFVMA